MPNGVNWQIPHSGKTSGNLRPIHIPKPEKKKEPKNVISTNDGRKRKSSSRETQIFLIMLQKKV
jgi:hypothetical protein